MTLREVFSILRARWLTVAVVTLVATLAGVAVAFLTPPTYSASTNIFIATPEVRTAEQAYAAGRFAQDRSVTYRDLATSEALATKTVARLQLAESPRDLARRVRATVNLDSVLLKLSVADRSASNAVVLANALSDDFVRMVKDLEQPLEGGPAVARAVVIKSANAAVWVAPDRKKVIGFAVLAGLVLGGIAALLRGFRKPTQWSEAAAGDVEIVTEGQDLATDDGLGGVHPDGAGDVVGDEAMR